MIDVLWCVLVWNVVGWGLWRGYRRERRADHYTLLTWTIFVMIAVVFTTRIKSLPPRIDRYLGDYPVTFLVDWLAGLVAVTLYAVSLKRLIERDPALGFVRHYHITLIWIAPLVAAAALVIMAGYIWGEIPWFDASHLMKLVFEGYGLLLAGLVFVPVNWRMMRCEQVLPMRVKHGATWVLCGTFTLNALLSVLFLPVSLVTGQPHPGPYLVPRGPIAAVCLVVILIPHRWIVAGRVLPQIRRYRRLRKREAAIGQFVSFRRESWLWRYTLRLSYVDMAIYTVLVSILDHYRRLNPCHPAAGILKQQLDAVLTQGLEYDDLVEAICRIRHKILLQSPPIRSHTTAAGWVLPLGSCSILSPSSSPRW